MALQWPFLSLCWLAVLRASLVAHVAAGAHLDVDVNGGLAEADAYVLKSVIENLFETSGEQAAAQNIAQDCIKVTSKACGFTVNSCSTDAGAGATCVNEVCTCSESSCVKGSVCVDKAEFDGAFNAGVASTAGRTDHAVPADVQAAAFNQAVANGHDTAWAVDNAGQAVKDMFDAKVTKPIQAAHATADQPVDHGQALLNPCLSASKLAAQCGCATEQAKAEGCANAQKCAENIAKKCAAADLFAQVPTAADLPSHTKANSGIAEVMKAINGGGQVKATCPYPAGGTDQGWSDSGTICVERDEIQCINGNTPYDSITQAWDRCSLDAECMKIQKYENQFYLRRLSDPGADNGGQTLIYE
jgi:hypothetical protein